MNIMIHTIILVLFFNTLGAYSETPVTSASEPLIPTNTEKTEEPGVSAPDPSSDPLTLPAEPESPATCSRLRLAREGVPVEKLISVNVGEIIKPYFQIEITNDDDSSAIGCSIDGVAIVNVIGVSTVDLKGNEAKFDNKMLATFDAISITSCLTKSSSGLGMIMLRFSAVVNGHSIHVDSQSIVPVALPQSSMIFSADAKDDSLIQADKGAPRYPIYIGQTLHPIIISILDSCGNLDVSTLDVHIDVFCTSCILDGTMSVYASRGQAIFSNIKINAIESSSPIYLLFTGSFSKKLVTIASAEFTVQQMPSESKLSTSFKVPMIISQYTLTDVLTSKLRQIICTQKCEIRISKRQRTSASNSIHATADIILYDSSNIGVETVTALLDLNKNDLSSWGLYQYSVTLGNSTDTQTELTLSTNESNLGKLSTWKWCVIVAVCSFLFVSALSWSTLICAKWRQESNQEAWDKANAHRNSEAMSSVNKLPITNKDQDCTSEPNSVKRSNKRNGTPQNKVKSERQTLNDSKPGSKEQTSNIQVKPSFHQKKGPGSTARMRFADMADLSTVNQEAKSTLNIDKKKGVATMQLSVGKKEEIAETFDDYNEDELKLYNAL